MMEEDCVYFELVFVGKNPHRIQESREEVKGFMKDWFLLIREEREKQYHYVWSLVYGWQLSQISQSFITNIETTNLHLHQEIEKTPPILPFRQDDFNYFQYIGKGQAFMKFQESLFYFNPSIHHNSQIDNIIVVLTSANLLNMTNFIKIHQKLKVRLITMEPIYKKLKKLIKFLNTFEPNPIQQPRTYLLKPEQHLEYSKIIWYVRQNCWFESTYDLTITFKHSKQIFLIQSQKLTETKLIYYGWKKNVITEQNYQKYIRQWETLIIRENSKPDGMHLIGAVGLKKKEKKDQFLEFIKKELICELQGDVQDQLFACCQLIQLIPSQIIAKVNYKFDYLYFLMQGSFQIIQAQKEEKQASLHKLYGLKQLKNTEKCYSFTLSSKSKGTLLRIQKCNISFHLYDILHP